VSRGGLACFRGLFIVSGFPWGLSSRSLYPYVVYILDTMTSIRYTVNGPIWQIFLVPK
jgi:hypothetical protein